MNKRALSSGVLVPYAGAEFFYSVKKVNWQLRRIFWTQESEADASSEVRSILVVASLVAYLELF